MLQYKKMRILGHRRDESRNGEATRGRIQFAKEQLEIGGGESGTENGFGKIQ